MVPVQYGFSEWPSADFPRIAWMAGSQSGTAMLAPRPAPTVTRLSPFVDQTGNTGRFSPNGDGVLDAAQVQYSLKEAATAVRLDVLNAPARWCSRCRWVLARRARTLPPGTDVSTAAPGRRRAATCCA